eukprot:COSAG04_NODE_351_length_16103_cov_3.615413_3_plen_89_part_00
MRSEPGTAPRRARAARCARCWHAAQPNHSGRPRESLIIQYAAFKWQQVGTLIDSVQRLEAADRIGDRPILRQILGLDPSRAFGCRSRR